MASAFCHGDNAWWPPGTPNGPCCFLASLRLEAALGTGTPHLQQPRAGQSVATGSSLLLHSAQKWSSGSTSLLLDFAHKTFLQSFWSFAAWQAPETTVPSSRSPASRGDGVPGHIQTEGGTGPLRLLQSSQQQRVVLLRIKILSLAPQQQRAS